MQTKKHSRTDSRLPGSSGRGASPARTSLCRMRGSGCARRGGSPIKKRLALGSDINAFSVVVAARMKAASLSNVWSKVPSPEAPTFVVQNGATRRSTGGEGVSGRGCRPSPWVSVDRNLWLHYSCADVIGHSSSRWRLCRREPVTEIRSIGWVTIQMVFSSQHHVVVQ